MRIGIDLQGLQSEGSRTRGIGRYSLEIVRNLIKVSPKHDFVLIANGCLKNMENKFRSELRLDNVSYFEWSSPCPFDYISGIQDFGARIDFDYMPNPNHDIKFGISYTNHEFYPGEMDWDY